METKSTSPTLRRRALAMELRKLRHAAGLTHTDVAKLLSWQQGKVSKIESAQQGIQVEAVIALADICEATKEQRERLVGLARTARARGWWESYADVLPSSRSAYIGFEAGAVSIRAFVAETIPDLFQTREYATEVLAARADKGEGSGVERKLEVLLERQRGLIEESATELDIVLAESAVRRAVGGRWVMRRQLRHLLDLMGRSNITIRVVPFSVGAIPAEVSFSIFGFQADLHPDLVFIPQQIDCTYSAEAKDVEFYRDTLRALESQALAPEASVRFIEEAERGVGG